MFTMKCKSFFLRALVVALAVGTSSVAAESESKPSDSGFCYPRKVIQPISPFSTEKGTACDEATARSKAERAYAEDVCTKDNDPQCSPTCADRKKECLKTVDYEESADPTRPRVMQCKSEPDERCKSGKRYTCQVKPTQLNPATCTCACF